MVTMTTSLSPQPMANAESQADSPSFYHSNPVPFSVIQQWFFAPLLPWQTQAWDYLTNHYPNLPHAMLFAGNAGTGKRSFVYRFIAWVLCQNKPKPSSDKDNHYPSACGHCESCQWLMAGTHPSLLQLPTLPIDDPNQKPKVTKTSSQKAAKLTDESPLHQTGTAIKIDDIRDMQPFVQQSSGGTRVVLIQDADTMTLGASNALLKTLEEPAPNVLLLLITDTPARLLATIRSRLQAVAVSQISPEQSLDYMHALVPSAPMRQLAQVNQLSGFAPFVGLDMLHSQWYQHRQTWINAWQALRSYQRTAIQASDYWQKTLTLSDFLYLSQIMLNDLSQAITGLGHAQTDLVLDKLEPMPTLLAIHRLQKIIDDIWRDRRQHVQDKLCYDKLLQAMQTC